MAAAVKVVSDVRRTKVGGADVVESSDLFRCGSLSCEVRVRVSGPDCVVLVSFADVAGSAARVAPDGGVEVEAGTLADAEAFAAVLKAAASEIEARVAAGAVAGRVGG